MNHIDTILIVLNTLILLIGGRLGYIAQKSIKGGLIDIATKVNSLESKKFQVPREDILTRLAEEGISLAEQHSRFQQKANNIKPTSNDKLMIAIKWMTDNALNRGIQDLTDAEARKWVEMKLLRR